MIDIDILEIFVFSDFEVVVFWEFVRCNFGVLEFIQQIIQVCFIECVFIGVGFYFYVECEFNMLRIEFFVQYFGNLEVVIESFWFGIGFVLFVENGYFYILEGFIYGEVYLGEVCDW